MRYIYKKIVEHREKERIGQTHIYGEKMLSYQVSFIGDHLRSNNLHIYYLQY